MLICARDLAWSNMLGRYWGFIKEGIIIYKVFMITKFYSAAIANSKLDYCEWTGVREFRVKNIQLQMNTKRYSSPFYKFLIKHKIRQQCYFNQPGKTRRRSIKGMYKLCFVIFWLLDYFSSWQIRRLIPFWPCYWHTLRLGRLCSHMQEAVRAVGSNPDRFTFKGGSLTEW